MQTFLHREFSRDCNVKRVWSRENSHGNIFIYYYYYSNVLLFIFIYSKEGFYSVKDDNDLVKTNNNMKGDTDDTETY